MTRLPIFDTLMLVLDESGVATCTFNRPAVRNALNRQMVDELHAVLGWLPDHDVRAVIFTGAGDKAFLGGADIAELRDRTRLDALRRINTGLFRAIEQLPMPTIAAIRGFALGGGCEMAMACDLRICGQGARLGQPEVALGIVPGAGATYRLPRLVGLGRAKELIYTGRIITADEALAIGLVNRVVADDQVLTAAHELAREITQNSALALRFAKISLNASSEASTDTSMALEAAAQAVLFEDEEKRRRMTAFLDRRAGPAKTMDTEERNG